MLTDILIVNSLFLLEKKLDRFSFVPVNKINVEIKFIDPTDCKKVASENRWQDNFTVDINEIFQDSDVSVIAEVNGHLAHWAQIAFKTAYVAGIEKKISVSSESAYIYGVYTAKNFRKMGIASAVIEKTAAYLCERGIRKVYLFANTHNLSMLKIAEKTGFKRIGMITLIKIGRLKLYRYKGNIKTLTL